MNTAFYIRLAKTFTSSTKILFLALSLFIFNSCKKELLTSNKENLTLTQNGSVKVTNINYSKFLEKVNLNSLGALKTTFQSQPTSSKLMSLGATALPKAVWNF